MSDYYLLRIEEAYRRKQRLLRPHQTAYLDSLPTSGEMYWYFWQTRQRSVSAYLRRTAYPFGMIVLWLGRIVCAAFLVLGLVVLVPLVGVLTCLVILAAVAYWSLESLVRKWLPARSPAHSSVAALPKVVIPPDQLVTLQQLDLELCALFAELTSTEIVARAEEWRRVLVPLEQQVTRSLALYAQTNGALMRLRLELRDYIALVRVYRS